MASNDMPHDPAIASANALALALAEKKKIFYSRYSMLTLIMEIITYDDFVYLRHHSRLLMQLH